MCVRSVEVLWFRLLAVRSVRVVGIVHVSEKWWQAHRKPPLGVFRVVMAYATSGSHPRRGQLLKLSNTGARLNGCYSKAHALVLELIYYKQNQKTSGVKL